MSYLKFAGLSLLTIIICGATFISLSLWLALVPIVLLGGIVFLIEPQHLKWGIGFWYLFSFLAMSSFSKWVPLILGPNYSDGIGWGTETEIAFLQVGTIIVLNPVGYWIGKLTYKMLHQKRAA